ncbi:hypothetical protein [Leptothoe sp. PORK10 BA2]|uniref:hypothetical protein n=1 Tax=Leptothoe sp. PORK10 BA2 TaxID=3110254 RepID=UPI002B2003BC|nr:hypothetical protein [Leptothoe sp. PORK10 BA2]MEA5463202.1 hypothetical protein [Leptothoe sp. PORK10 BA2]
MTLASDVLRHLQRLLAQVVGPVVLVALLLLTSCNSAPQPETEIEASAKAPPAFFAPRPALKQVDPPALIQELAPWLDAYAPQVQIRQPKAEQVFDTTTVKVSLRVQDLPIYKDEPWDMGPHVQILLDNQPYESVYDLEQPIILQDLAPGTHTLRAFALGPWDESFKNEGSYAQVTFHILAKTDENSPGENQPLLTYVSPVGTYGAEPVLLDFYLTNAPLHQVAEDNPGITDWRVRYTLNGDSLMLKDWESIYIEGLKPGQNWVQLTLVDEEDNPIGGVFNNTIRLINYDPALDNSLAKIVRGDLTFAQVGGIIDPTYEPPIPEPTITETPETPASQDSEENETIDLNSEPEAASSDTASEDTSLIEDATSKPASSAESMEDATSDKASSVESMEGVIPKVIEPKEAEPEKIQPGEIEAKTSNQTRESKEPSAPSDDGQDTRVEQSSTLEPESLQADEPPSPAILDALDTPEAEVITEDGQEYQASDSQASDREQAEEIDQSTTAITESRGEGSPESEVEPSRDESEVEPSRDEEASPSKRRYLQRLYDYRERSMQTYGRDR